MQCWERSQAKVISNQNKKNHQSQTDLKSKSQSVQVWIGLTCKKSSHPTPTVYSKRSARKTTRHHNIAYGVGLILDRTTKSNVPVLQTASEAKIKFTKDEFVLSINSCWNVASDNLFLRGVRNNPPMPKRRSNGAEEGKWYCTLET